MPKSLPDELYHYTGTHGLKGIINSQTLWATHYRYLNDTEEVTLFRDRLPNFLRPVFKNIFAELNPQEQQLLLDEYHNIEMAEKEESKKLATTMYNHTFVGVEKKPPIAEPYITAFCRVDKNDERVANHGLLSQWRGYGAQGGYSIIFDAEQLHHLVEEEAKKWAYSTGFSGDVVYSSATDEEIYDEFGEHIDAIQKNWGQALRTRDPKALENTYSRFIACACRFKHWGFAEENEFRIVLPPTSSEIVEVANKRGKTLLAKPVRFFLRNGTMVPYLNLFEGITGSSCKRLPIKRIIVGPHPEKEKRKLAVEKLLSQYNIEADVSVSEIPFLG
jgi:hypothetical protein